MNHEIIIDELIRCGTEVCQKLSSQIESVPDEYRQLREALQAEAAKLMETFDDLDRARRKAQRG
jgi:hypothetical protein